MKTILLVLALTVTSTSAFAGVKCNLAKDPARCENAQAIAKLLSSEKTPEIVQDLLVAVLNAPSNGLSPIITQNELTEAALGTEYRTIRIEKATSKDETFEILIQVKSVRGKVSEVKIVDYAG